MMVPLDRLTPYPGNARVHDDALLGESVRQHGQYRALVVQASTGHILAGNGTYHALAAEGAIEALVHYVDCDDDEARRLNLVDNRAGDRGGYDDALLTSLLRSLPDLSGTGYDEDDLTALLAKVTTAPEALTDPDDVPPIPAEAFTKPGDLWLLGEHRLLCGDATKRVDVERLMAGAASEIVVTDPPYGIGYDAASRDRAKSVGLLVGDSQADWREVWTLFSAPVVYAWHASMRGHEARIGLEMAGYVVRCQIVWIKPYATLGRGDYHWQHEPCWYAVREGASSSWTGQRDQSSVWEMTQPKDPFGRSGEDVTPHPTQKPVEAMARPLRNHRVRIAADPFAGSGTTLIAAHQTGRVAYLMEIDPLYCDVICRRFQEHTDIIPVLEATGEEHDFTMAVDS
jgi:DNA modification methylase